jgi:hypothetical protein
MISPLALVCVKCDGSCYPISPRALLSPLETTESNTFYQQDTRNANGDNVEQIPIDQRGFEKRQVEISSVNTTCLLEKREVACS